MRIGKGLLDIKVLDSCLAILDIYSFIGSCGGIAGY
jgi:hypothetical protein